MIWTFLIEYRAWYLTYLVMSGTYWLTFYLYRLPMSYFGMSILFNLTFLIMISMALFIKFRKKMQILHDFIYLDELAELHSPSELVYQQLISHLKDSDNQLLSDIKEQLKQQQDLIKMWSHQMKVPLSALSLMAQTDQMDSREVRQQLLRLGNYIDTLLTYLKFNQNKDDFRFEECSVREIVTDLVKKYRIAFLVKHLSIDIEGEWLLKTDKKWLSFAISQILDNAVKYSNPQSSLNIRMTDSSIVIADKGIGILEEDLPRIFEEGFTGYNGHEDKKATGLGLYMTKQVLDQLNLTIQVQSRVGQGTIVSILQKSLR